MVNFLSGISCGIYTTNSVEQNEIILRDSGSKIVIVENKQQLEKILKCIENNCEIARIIQYQGVPENNYNGLVMSVRFKLNFKFLLKQRKTFYGTGPRLFYSIGTRP